MCRDKPRREIPLFRRQAPSARIAANQWWGLWQPNDMGPWQLVLITQLIRRETRGLVA